MQGESIDLEAEFGGEGEESEWRRFGGFLRWYWDWGWLVGDGWYGSEA